jgi:hypothetical protein
VDRRAAGLGRVAIREGSEKATTSPGLHPRQESYEAALVEFDHVDYLLTGTVGVSREGQN